MEENEERLSTPRTYGNPVPAQGTDPKDTDAAQAAEYARVNAQRDKLAEQNKPK